MCSVVVLLGILDYWAYPYGAALGGRSRDRGENGLWLRYTWYFGEHSPSDVAALADRLEREHIRYAFFYARFITKEGTLKFHHPEASRLIADLRKRVPDVKSVASLRALHDR